ncbi:MAG: response regulator [Planctomycetota bacterium]|nr:response regulator [Planctomycetota bacterium]
MKPADFLPANLMVVDDEPVNLRLLVGMLRERGYRVSAFPRGRLALAAAEQEPPDLILLDIIMPEMTGYQVCEQLKANPKLKDIPVMFMSALDEMMDKVRAFEVGGIDYIAKPYQLPEVETRVRTQVRLVTLERELARHRAQLDDLVSQRTHQLVEAHGRRAVLEQAQSDLLEVLTRELPAPMDELFGLVDKVFAECSWSKAVRESQDRYDSCRQQIRTLLEEASLLPQLDAGSEAAVRSSSPLDVAQNKARDRIGTLETRPLTEKPLLLPQLDAGGETAVLSSSPLDLALCKARDRIGTLAQSRNIGVDFVPTDLGLTLDETELLGNSLQSLLETALNLLDMVLALADAYKTR